MSSQIKQTIINTDGIVGQMVGKSGISDELFDTIIKSDVVKNSPETINAPKKPVWQCEYKSNDSSTELEFDFYPKIIIIHPTPERNYCIVKSESTDEWIHIVNIYSLKRNPHVSDIIKIVRKYVKSQCSDTSNDDLERTIRSNRNNTNEFIINEYVNTICSLKSESILVSLTDNNIEDWKFVMKNFKNPNLHNVVIEVYMRFDQKTYPKSPPVIEKITPNMARSLNQKIIKLKMISPENWKQTTNMKTIFTRIFEVFEEYGKVEEKSYYDDATNTLITNLVSILGITSDFVDIDNEKQTKTQSPTHKSPSGTHGIGYDDVGNTTSWKLDEYVQKKSERNSVVPCIMMDIIDRLSQKSEDIYKFIIESAFIKCATVILSEMTPLDIVENAVLYHSIYSVLEKIPICYLKDVIDISFDGTTLSKCVDNNYEIASKPTVASRAKDKIISLKQVIDTYRTEPVVNTTTSTVCEYVNTMTKYRFGEDKITSTGYYYANALKDNIMSKKAITRLFAEYTSLQIDLPINADASIFVKIDPTNMSAMRALIIGPKDTPYENGCFIFDIFIPGTYPNNHPDAHFMNHGGNRFNPNLYADGKVCLSLIGTWGNQHDKSNSENWNPATSTLFQLLLSIQAQILVEEPWFNEPGRDRYRNSSAHSKERDDYNKQIQMFTLQHAIMNLVETCDKHYGEFSEIIKNHFKLKKDEIHKRYSAIEYPGGKAYYNAHKHVIDAL